MHELCNKAYCSTDERALHQLNADIQAQDISVADYYLNLRELTRPCCDFQGMDARAHVITVDERSVSCV